MSSGFGQMETKAAHAAIPDLVTAKTPALRVANSERPVSAVEASADLRLVIEQNEETGGYVYLTVNRRTGEVVQRLPREDLLKMAADDTYAAGQVISTQV